MKINGYPQGYADLGIEWHRLPIILRKYGLLLLLLPMGWFVMLYFYDRLKIKATVLSIIGSIMAMGILGLFLSAAQNLYYRPMISHTGDHNSE